jgi:hypothetical protein
VAVPIKPFLARRAFEPGDDPVHVLALAKGAAAHFSGFALNRPTVAIFNFYFAFITLMNLPSGIPMHLSAHQPQQQLARCERSSLRCGHENHKQNSPSAK